MYIYHYHTEWEKVAYENNQFGCVDGRSDD